jgi:muconolactone D-isomerase
MVAQALPGIRGRTNGCEALDRLLERVRGGRARSWDNRGVLVEFKVNIPHGTPESEVRDREIAEATAAGKLVDEGHLVRLWKPQAPPGETKTLGLYRADSETELDALLRALPLSEWMRVTITPLGHHPNDPTPAQASG